jgi:antitoxin component YwqK of YwqJK toxin-antitoxin module
MKRTRKSNQTAKRRKCGNELPPPPPPPSPWLLSINEDALWSVASHLDVQSFRRLTITCKHIYTLLAGTEERKKRAACTFLRYYTETYLETHTSRSWSQALDGMMHGIEEWHFEDKSLQRVNNWRMGKLHGISQTWDGDVIPDGHHKYSFATWNRGVKHGPARTYNAERGGFLTEEYYNGNLHGVTEFYLDTGVRLARQEWQHGKLHGKTERWYSNGRRDEVSYYKNGKSDGEQTRWSATTGRVMEHGNFVDGQRHGKWLIYDYSGNIMHLTNYCNGKRHGISKIWNGSRQLTERTEWRNGSMHGYHMRWNDAGQLIHRSHYVNGDAVGTSEWWRNDGTVSCTKVHSKDGRLRTEIEYDKDGYERRCIYIDGMLRNVRETNKNRVLVKEEFHDKNGCIIHRFDEESGQLTSSRRLIYGSSWLTIKLPSTE